MSKRVAGAGAAGVAAVFAVMPFAEASPAGPAATTTPSPGPGAVDGSNQAGTQAQQPQGEVEPDFGIQKIRVGVQIKGGSWVPPGTDTGNTEITIVETGPNAGPGGSLTTTCRTVEGSEDPGSTETYCEFNIGDLSPAARSAAQSEALQPNVPELFQLYWAAPGDTVTFTQTTVNKGLVIDPVPQTVGPCVQQPPRVAAAPQGLADFPFCPGFSGDPVDVVFTDPGLPPTAVNNHATVLSGHSVVIDVLKNDITHGAPVQIDSTTQPSHGKVFVAVGQALAADHNASDAKAPGDPQYTVEYKSTAPYVGPDKFRYTISTPNGKSTATVFITVIAPPPIAVDDSRTTDQNTPVTIDVLANDNARGGGALSVQSVGTPSHGAATISDGQIVYTPDADFVGTDTFPYTNATQFGTDTALVTVTIEATGLANTGSSSHNLANLGLLLLISGGAATVVGRRRYVAKHAGLR